MKLFFSILSLLFLSILHADGIAEYHYYMEQNQIVLKFEMDLNELKHYQTDMGCTESDLINLCVANYLASKSSLTINEENVHFEFVSSSIYNDHIIFNFKSTNKFKDVKNIQIINNSFFEINSHFKNRIRLDINQFNKSFLLTKGKGLISL